MPEFVNASGAAEMLGLDKRTILRMARSGRLRSFRTPGGQHRFRREDVERLRAGDSRAPDPVSSSATVQNKRDEVESLNLDVQARRARRELARIEAEDEATERQRHEAQRAEALASKRALAEIRARRDRERLEAEALRTREAEEREAARLREATERERRNWRAQTLSEALALLPRDVPPDTRAAASEVLRQALASLEPSDPRQLVQASIDIAITQALAPWQRRKEIEQVVAEAERSLPLAARSFCEPTDWQIRYRSAADAAIRTLPTDTLISQVRATMQNEARRLAAEFERGETEARHRRNCAATLESIAFWRVLDSDRTAARTAVSQALAALPVGSTVGELQKAATGALAPFEKRKEAAARAEDYLAHVSRYVEEIGGPDGEWDLGGYLERRRFAERMTKKIRPGLIDSLVGGNVEDQGEAEEFIEEAVDAELENGD